LHKFAILGVVTTKTGKYSAEILRHLGVMDYFRTLVGREHVTYPKPHAQPILKALENLNHKKKDTVWMIGDTPMDILSASNAGVNSVAVTSGYASYVELNRCASKICTDVSEAVKYIKNYDAIYK